MGSLYRRKKRDPLTGKLVEKENPNESQVLLDKISAPRLAATKDATKKTAQRTSDDVAEATGGEAGEPL